MAFINSEFIYDLSQKDCMNWKVWEARDAEEREAVDDEDEDDGGDDDGDDEEEEIIDMRTFAEEGPDSRPGMAILAGVFVLHALPLAIPL